MKRFLAVAQFCMGWMYDKGRGVPQNYNRAVTWYRRAADQGFGGRSTIWE
ncbi:MAG: SEL1-like repeat protein [Parvularculales bacterium]